MSEYLNIHDKLSGYRTLLMTQINRATGFYNLSYGLNTSNEYNNSKR